MTREEAIKLLVNATYSDEWQGNEDLTTAHNMAIKVLEQESVIDKIRAEINKPVIRDKYSQRQNDYCDGVEFMCNRIKEIIDKYNAESEG